MSVAFTSRTAIRVSPDRVFAASLSIEDHLASMTDSGERAVDGVTTGRIGLGQTVTWRARHFGVPWTMTSQITELVEPLRFVDEQVRGPFESFRHEHVFRSTTDGTEMLDNVTFRAPLGALGWMTERAVLSWYLPRLILKRNAYLKTSLEH